MTGASRDSAAQVATRTNRTIELDYKTHTRIRIPKRVCQMFKQGRFSNCFRIYGQFLRGCRTLDEVAVITKLPRPSCKCYIARLLRRGLIVKVKTITVHGNKNTTQAGYYEPVPLDKFRELNKVRKARSHGSALSTNIHGD